MDSNAAQNKTSDHDYSEFLSEYLLQTKSQSNESEVNYEDGEMEAEWLVSAGYPELTKPFKEGLELRITELDPVITTLSKPHAEVIIQRVKALNQTVRGRTKSRSKRKPDIRDVFRDFDESSTGTRSRSATPDSLDSIHADEVWLNSSVSSFVSIVEKNGETGTKKDDQLKDKHLKHDLRRTPSAPLKSTTSSDIFRGSHVRCDIPLYSAHGVELLGFSRIGTIHFPRNRSGSDPFCSAGGPRETLLQDLQSENNASSGNSWIECADTLQNKKNNQEQSLLDDPSMRLPSVPCNGLSFESICRDNSSQEREEELNICDISSNLCSDIALLSEIDLKHLQKILWLELATIFDSNQVSLDKRKPFKRRRKEEGSLFGVSLNALIRRDQQVTGTDSTLVPLFLENLLAELSQRGSREEGILRIGGHKQKTDILYNEFELNFYQKPEKLAHVFATASVHELGALLKRWLRELPQPLLTNELIKLFYQCHALPLINQRNALSIVCQLLPPENRNTLRSLLKFLNFIIDLSDINKMNLHNISTIIAPSFFPPRFIHPSDKNSIPEQVKMAAQCCHLTKVLILRGEKLFQVPNKLIEESKSYKLNMGKKGWPRRDIMSIHETTYPSGRENNSSSESSTAVVKNPLSNTNHVHRFVI
ncbi:rho GTPase-activating protein conundrum [Drosophila ficusphila]|uniref:rho GTPase-activating protein conundrum n=1 Tax=Drosophila ficusphila TaxID=30025 RepID=UPI0007E83F8A|nr:rho GTPase-activating protein conundrum [Drosophila ficusphila]XP_017055113.1 rho GTPase-activating protein conundrum [Drosophila ficusphila]